MLVAGFAALSCGGDQDPQAQTPSAPEPVRTDTASAQAPPAAASPEPGESPVWVPPGTFACDLGPGTPDAGCEAGVPVFAGAVNAAVDRVIAERLDLWPNRDLTERVRDEEAIHLAVIDLLRPQGYCAGWDLTDLQVRNSTDFSEHYDLFDSRGFIHLDPAKRVRSTCRPASFPLTAGERIYSLRVGFYGIQCPAGVPKPPNSSNRLAVGCLGHVTATPKDKFGHDVDARVHGPYISWTLQQRREIVSMREDTNVAFNKALRANDSGSFVLCATVQGKTGCLEGFVSAN